jgi:hypothetical protein
MALITFSAVDGNLYLDFTNRWLNFRNRWRRLRASNVINSLREPPKWCQFEFEDDCIVTLAGAAVIVFKMTKGVEELSSVSFSFVLTAQNQSIINMQA